MHSTPKTISSSVTVAALNYPSYRCHLCTLNQPCAPDRLLDDTIQVKARNAVEAERIARLTTNKAVIDVVRLDG